MTLKNFSNLLKKRYLNIVRDLTNEQEELDDKLFFQLQMCLSERILDSNLHVQKTAIQAAYLLQQPKEKYCPIISSYLHLLKHESVVDIKLIVLDLIVLNTQTFDFMKSNLLFDTNIIVRDKVLSLIEKKIPVKYIDSKMKKKLIDCALSNKNYEILEKFLIKWIHFYGEQYPTMMDSNNNEVTNGNKYNCLEFFKSLSLEDLWFNCHDYKAIYSVDLVLAEITKTVFKYLVQTFGSLELIENLTLLINNNPKSLFKDINLAFYFRSLVRYFYSNNKIDLVESNLKIKLEIYFPNLINNLRANKSTTLIYYNLIDSLYYLNIETLNLDDDDNSLFKELINSIQFHDSNICLFELIFSKYESNSLGEFLKAIFNIPEFNDDYQIKKLMALVIAFLTKLTDSEFSNLQPIIVSYVNEDNSDHFSTSGNIVEYLVRDLILKQVSSLDPTVRILAIRALGLFATFMFDASTRFLAIFKNVGKFLLYLVLYFISLF
jgi:hypothetical protein